MFEFGNNPSQHYRTHAGVPAQDANTLRINTAINQFKWRLFCGRIARLLNRARRLYDLNTLQESLRVRGGWHAGIRSVELSKIVGSEGRVEDFDRDFHPLSERAQERWVSVAAAYLSHLPMPAVELIQVGEIYFVRDGHHRISVARAFGQKAIDADVVTWNARPPFPWQETAASPAMKKGKAHLST